MSAMSPLNDVSHHPNDASQQSALCRAYNAGLMLAAVNTYVTFVAAFHAWVFLFIYPLTIRYNPWLSRSTHPPSVDTRYFQMII